MPSHPGKNPVRSNIKRKKMAKKKKPAPTSRRRPPARKPATKGRKR